MRIDKVFEKPIISILLLACLAYYLFFFQLGSLPLTDPDETFYAQTAREMHTRNEWLTPYLYGKPQFEKPVLFYWLVHLSYKMFGVNEAAARLPSAVFGFLGLVAIYFLGALLFNRRVGILSAIILATNVEYIMLSRACITDMVLFTLMLAGALFFFQAYLGNRRHFYLLSAAAFGLATLTKGPIAIILSGGVILAFLIITGEFSRLKKMPLFSATIVFLAVAAPWYIAMCGMHGKDFIESFFGFHNITRFLESEHKMGSQFYYNIPVVFGGFFPWSVFIIFAFWRSIRKCFSTDPAEKNHNIFILLWFLVIFIFFSISSTKLPTYIFPSFSALAIIAAIFWDDFLEESVSGPIAKQMKISFYLLSLVIVVGTITALVFVWIDYPSVFTSMLIALGFLAFGMFLSLAAFIRKMYIAAFFLIAYSVILFLYPMGKLAAPELGRYETCKEVGGVLSSFMKPEEALGSESHYLGGLAYYTGKTPVNLDRHHILVQFLSSKDRVWCVLKEKNFRQFYELDTEPVYSEPSYMVYKLDKKCVITNKIPEDGIYIMKRGRKE